MIKFPMVKKPVYGVILAGGKSSRYHRLRHKFLDLYQGKEIILHVYEAMKPLVEKVVIVVGKEHEEVRRIFRGKKEIVFCIQETPLGTGHALLSTAPYLEGKDVVMLVSFADKPLITTSTLKKLVDTHLSSGAEITFATAVLPDPGTKGRIIRKDGVFVDIVEYKDADENIKKIKEVHAGYLCCYSRSIFRELRKLDNNNAQKEYYLTKVYSKFLQNGFQVKTVEIPGVESYDVNYVHQLDNIEKWKEIFRSP